MDYKKYKPLSQPGKCNECHKRNILKAYRSLCDPCALKKVEIRVPREQAIEMGLLKVDESEELNNAAAADIDDQGNVQAARVAE